MDHDRHDDEASLGAASAAPVAVAARSRVRHGRAVLLMTACAIAAWELCTWANVLPDYLADALDKLLPATIDADGFDMVERLIFLGLSGLALACAATATSAREVGLRTGDWSRQLSVTAYGFWGMLLTNLALTYAATWWITPTDTDATQTVPDPSAGPLWWQAVAYTAAAAEEIVAIAIPVLLMRTVAEHRAWSPKTRQVLGWCGVAALAAIRASYHLWLGPLAAVVAVVAVVEVMLYRRFGYLIPLMVAHCMMDTAINIPAAVPFVGVAAFGMTAVALARLVPEKNDAGVSGGTV